MVKAIETNRKDCISALPDEILHHILTLLPSTKETLKTSLLSKRWQHLCTCIPNLIFRLDDFSHLWRESESLHSGRENATSWLDKTLSLYSSSKVDKLCIVLDFYYKKPLLDSGMYSWLLSAVRRDVEGLTLDFKYVLPQFLYQNPRLLKLETKFCEFAPNGRVSWDSLKYLKIGYAHLTDELVRNILQGTPLLHSLTFYGCFGFDIVDLSLNTHLKILVIDDSYFEFFHSQFQITAPNLEEFEILGYWYNMECKLMNMSSLVRATLDFKLGEGGGEDNCFVVAEECKTATAYGNTLKELLKNVCHAKQLKLGNWCLQVLSTLRLNVTPSLSSDCKCLILDIRHFEKSIIPGIACLLLNSHELEKLVMYFGRCAKKFCSDEEIPENYWTSHTQIFNCLEFHLKTVEIFGFNASELYSEDVFQFLRFLLAEGKVLERMVIHDTKKSSVDKNELEEARAWLSCSSPFHAVVVLAD